VLLKILLGNIGERPKYVRHPQKAAKINTNQSLKRRCRPEKCPAKNREWQAEHCKEL
jgi:hypothetical protein